ncbi:hypothetical protein [Luteococcus peritonei]|uniref:DUF2178 domain-containing protein n=1 Tax=Luteococcus peritonei TaxID=88874 RepID=A0ABW4RTY6_9ACTN
MSRTDRPSSARLAPLLGMAAVLSVFAAFYPRDPETAWGALAGGLAAVVVMLVLQRRRDGGLLGRQVRGQGDERDQTITQRSLATVGLCSFFGCAAAMVAVVWGMDPLVALGLMTWLLLAVAVGAHLWFARRL